jgi:hypothetical protein
VFLFSSQNPPRYLYPPENPIPGQINV